VDRNKKIFIIFGIIFLIILIIIAIDISTRTTFPGSKGNLQEEISPENSLLKLMKSDFKPYLAQV
jgi:hypothetical protein